MLRTSFGRVRGRLGASHIDVFASTIGRIQSIAQIDDTSSYVAPNRTDSSRAYPLLMRIHGVSCRTHVATRPIVLGTASPHYTDVSLLTQRYIQKRCMSSEKKIKNESSGDSKSETTKETAEASEQGSSRLSSIVRSVGPTLRKVTEWNVGDLLSVYAIVLLIALIIFSPYVVAQMKKAETEYIELDEYDPVAQMEKIIRYDVFGEKALEKEYEKEEKTRDLATRRSIDNTIDMAADVLQSEALQGAIASLITRVLESVQFQNACQTLLKNLWNDLVNDPETTAQVVQLLNNAIQNKEIQRSVRRLVLQLIKDKEVYDELTRLLVRLGQEEEVLDATRTLLTVSAHNALNDPEILDHSMEFATDVVGDDIVQRTSGEALRNTVTYAAGPSFSAFLSILGIGLVWFAISAFGKSRASEQEAAMVDKALSSMARSIQSSTREGVTAVASLPGRLLSMLASVITFPFRLVEKGFSGLGRTGESIFSAISNGLQYAVALPGILLRAAMSQFERLGRSISERASGTICRIGAAISASFIGPILCSIGNASRSVFLELSRVTGPVRNIISAGVDAVGIFLIKVSAAMGAVFCSAGTCVNATIAVSSRIIGSATVRLGGICSRYGTVVKSAVISLAASSQHSQKVALEVVKRLSTQCGNLLLTLTANSEHARTVTMELFNRFSNRCGALTKSFAAKSGEVIKNIGASLAVASGRASSSIVAAVSWCLKLFRGDGKSDSTTSTSLL